MTALRQDERRVYCGGEHTLIVSPNGLTLYQLGACGLGFNWGADNTSRRGPGDYVRRVLVPGPFRDIASGYYHNLLATTSGRCFSYGCGRQAPNDGQLGNGSTAEHTEPKAAPSFLRGFCGGHHSVLQTAIAVLRTCGAGWQAQMGNGAMDRQNPQLQTVSTSQGFAPEALAGGYYHNAAVGGGRCEVWGCNEQKQLGGGSGGGGGGGDSEHVKVPEDLRNRVNLPKGHIAAFDGGYGHSVVLVGGRVFCFGANEYNQCGPDGEEGAAREIALPGPASAVCAGNHHSMALVDGKVYAWGSNEYGQVSGDGEMGDAVGKPREVPIPEQISFIDAGICHAAAQGKSGSVYLWGCGGNGQTGLRELPEASSTRTLDFGDLLRRCSGQE